jgi:nitroreductase
VTQIDLDQAMSTLRAVRRLRPDPIPDAVMERVLQAAAWAPSGGNQQPWHLVVVTDPERKQQLADVYAPEWARFAVGYQRRAEGLAPEQRDAMFRTVAAGDHLAATMQDAPALLVLCFDPRRMAITDAGLDRPSVIAGASIYPAVQNLMLACVAEGLGCVLTTLHCFREDDVKRILDIPEPWGTGALIPIGYPVGTGHGPITRKAPSELASRDRFGVPWPGPA